MAHFLNLDGLQTLWNSIVAKIGDMISTKADLASPALTGTPTAPTASSGTDTTQIANTAFVQDAIDSILPTTWYGTCDTTASTQIKSVTCSDYILKKGSVISILFTKGNTYNTPQLNINSTGSKGIYVGNGPVDGTTNVLKWSSNTLLVFMYDGMQYRYIASSAGTSGGTVQHPEGAGSWYAASATAATDATKIASVDNFRLTRGALVSVSFTYANTKNDAALKLNVNSTGAKTIYVNNVATSATNHLLWNAGETLTFIYTGSYYYFLCKSGSNVGTIVEADLGSSGTTAVATGTNTNLLSISLPAGVWVVNGMCAYNKGGTDAAYRACYLGSTSSGNQYGSQQQPGCSSGNTIINVTGIVSLSSTSTVYLNTVQGSGGDLNIVHNNTRIRAVRIA